MARQAAAPADMITLIDFLMTFCEEKKENNGEDAEKHALNREAALISVFDGCGGAGARVYQELHNKTGAYIASRAAADALEDWFDQEDPAGRTAEDLKQRIVENLNTAASLTEEPTQLLGMISKKLPTTMAAAVCAAGQNVVHIDLYWAGDSRVYLLDQDGLKQLTEDDLGGIDAFENLSEDGALTNMINLSTAFTIHTGSITMRKPGFVFAATDGCFGYLPTPMDFEYLLLKTLEQASSAYEWEQSLRGEIQEVAGDDYTLSGIALGYQSFSALKEALRPRTGHIFSRYIKDADRDDKEAGRADWLEYKEAYSQWMIQAQ